MNLSRRLARKFKENYTAQAQLIKGNALLFANFALIAFETIYIMLRIPFVNAQIPFWYTQLWGDPMFAPKNFLYLLPITSLLVMGFGMLFGVLLHTYFVRHLREVLLTFITLVNVMLFYSVLRIIFIASVPFPALISPLALQLLTPFLALFVASRILLPFFINFMEQRDIVTNPHLHSHPGMVLQSPSARGGGSLYAFLFILGSMVFVGLPNHLVGLYIAVMMLGVLGYVDDYQNTHPKSAFKALENPLLRLLLLFSAIGVLVFSQVVITTVANPLGGVLDLSIFKISVDHLSVSILMYIFTALWVGWVINMMSWSNGIDGQFSGIVGITSVFICLLALRFTPLTLEQKQVAVMGAISAGIAFGFAKDTWFPSRVMWGFGATSAAMVIATLSILIQSKILVSVLILLVPFLDAVVTFVRRILQGKSPLKGDRGHLHHLLLDRGWTVPQIAKFYWATTLICGLIGTFASDKYLLQTFLIVGGVVAFVIILMNLKSLEKR
jgi:UDP-GlcNAc:undecaprenyl-phosphate/decaprenyl-phosphate GlcNAc-1-phosphate transferase